MAKKSGRNQEQDIRLSEAQLRRPLREDDVSFGADEEASREASSGASELAQEYHYVLADLRRIGIIAIVMVGALVGLAILLP